MAIKLIIVAVVLAMVVSLFMALYYMFKDRGKSTRTVKALTWRVGIWAFLLAMIGLGVMTGVITPSNSLNPALNQTLQQNNQ